MVEIKIVLDEKKTDEFLRTMTTNISYETFQAIFKDVMYHIVENIFFHTVKKPEAGSFAAEIQRQLAEVKAEFLASYCQKAINKWIVENKEFIKVSDETINEVQKKFPEWVHEAMVIWFSQNLKTITDVVLFNHQYLNTAREKYEDETGKIPPF